CGIFRGGAGESGEGGRDYYQVHQTGCKRNFGENACGAKCVQTRGAKSCDAYGRIKNEGSDREIPEPAVRFTLYFGLQIR
ncbi:MAG: hypothetical protein WC873_03540, partial [Candidatus Gracilibacteria bacterium]